MKFPPDRDQPLSLDFEAFAQSFDNVYMGSRETARRADPKHNLLVLASSRDIIRCYFSLDPQRSTFLPYAEIHFGSNSHGFQPETITLNGEGYWKDRESDFKFWDFMMLTLSTGREGQDSNVFDYLLEQNRKTTDIFYEGDNFSSLGFSMYTNVVNGPQAIPFKREQFVDPSIAEVRVSANNGFYIAHREGNMVHVVRTGNSKGEDKFDFPLQLDRQQVIEELITPELIADPWGADADVDKLWKKMDIQDLTGIDIHTGEGYY